jgi:dUTP pyrophosphatase
METAYIKVKKLDERATLPTKREEDAGYDLYAIFEEDPLFFYPGDIYLASTGLSTQFPKELTKLILKFSIRPAKVHYYLKNMRP